MTVSEQQNVAAANPEVVETLTTLMKKYIADGRSTVGAVQKSEAPLSVDGGSGGGKKEQKKKRNNAMGTITNALNPDFD